MPSYQDLLKRFSNTDESDASIDADEQQAMEDAQLKRPVPDLINDAADDMIASEETSAQRAPAAMPSENSKMNDASTVAMPETASSPAPNPTMARYQDLLRQAQESRRQQLAGADIYQGGATIAQGFARGHGANIGDQSEFASSLRKNAELPVTELGEQVKGRMDDPQSDISQYMRAQAVAVMKKMNPNADVTGLNNMSANELQKLPGINKLLTTANQKPLIYRTVIDPATGQSHWAAFDPMTGEKVRDVGEAGFATQFRENPQSKELVALRPSRGGQAPVPVTGPKPEAIDAKAKEGKGSGVNVDKSLLNVRQIEQVDNARKDFITEAKDDINALQSSTGVMRILNGPKDGKLDQDIIRAIQNQLARASGERGAMTENDVAGFGGRGALVNRLERMLSIQSTGKLPEEDRKLLTNVAGIMQKRAKDFIDQRANFYTENMYNDFASNDAFKGKKINRDSVKNLLGVQEYLNPTSSASEGKTVKVKGPSGQVATMTEKNAKKYLSKPGYSIVP